MWLPNLEGRRGPVYRAIADAIDEDVQSGALRAGARLPPHRDLADHLGVTVTTITRAYTEAARRGLISGHVGRGTFIRGQEPRGARRRRRPARPQHQRPDARQGGGQPRVAPVPAPRAAVDAAARLRAAPRATCGTGRRWRRGSARLGLAADPEQLVLTAGAQHALAGDVRRAAQAGRHGAGRGADLLRRAAARAAAAPEDARRGDGRRRAAARRARRRLPHDAGARPLLHAAAAEPDVGGDVREAPPADCRRRREASPDRRRGRHLRVPVAGADAAGGADSGADDLRHQPVEEPVPGHAARLRRGAAGDARNGSSPRCGRR